MTLYDEAVRRARFRAERTGETFDESDLLAAAQFRPYYDRDVRVQVTTDEYVRTGRVSMTFGWRPAFLLMHRSSDRGSSDLLGPRDRVTAVQYDGRKYVTPQG